MEKKKSIGIWLVEGLMHLQGMLPLGYHRFLARIIAWLIGDVFHYRNHVVLVNLSRSFPEKTYEEIKQLRKQFYRHFANTFTEMIWFGACKGKWGRKRLHRSHIVEISNPEEMNRMFNASRQMMILQTHTGNWELISGFREYSYGEPIEILPSQIGVAYAALRSAFWDRIIGDNRIAPVADQGFDGYRDTYHILRFVLSKRNEKMAYPFITDQFPYWANGTMAEVEFMHRKTVTMTAAASLASKMDMSVVYLRYETRPEGGYTMTFVPMYEHAGGVDPETIMKQYYKLLEEDLEKQPWNYLWTHKRWKLK